MSATMSSPEMLSSAPAALTARFDENALVANAYSTWLDTLLPLQFPVGTDQAGGFEMEVGTGWCDGRESAYILGKLIAARCWIDRIDVDRGRLDEAIRRCTSFILRRQLVDGTLDLGGGFTPNEAGFPITALVEGYTSLQKYAPRLFADIEGDLKSFLLKAADAVLDGQAYTANHRWAAACAPLAAVHSLWPDDRYLRKIDGYLADGIDCDPQGAWYEERSPNYNAVANGGLIEMAYRLNKPQLLDHVIHNLHLTLYTTQPNGEADTSFSHRQDRGRAGFSTCAYGHARRVALLTGDGRYATLALAAATPDKLLGDLMPMPFQIDRHPGAMPKPLPLPDRYDIDIPVLHASRFRSGHTALTVSADPGGHFFDSVRDNWGGVRRSDDWLHLQHGDVVVQSIHLSPSSGLNIQPATLERMDAGEWRLRGSDPGWKHTLHFRPGKPLLAMGGEQKHEIAVRASGNEVSFDLDCQSSHTAIAAISFYIRPGVTFQEGDGPVTPLTTSTKLMLSGGQPLTLRGQTASIRITGLPSAEHAMPLANSSSISSAIQSTCGRLSIGLRLPVAVKVKMELL